MRTVDTQLLANWRQNHGEQADTWLANAARCSFYTIMRIRKGHVPLRRIREDLSRAIGYPEDQLFPRAGNVEQERPSTN